MAYSQTNKVTAAITMALGVAAIILPAFVGTFAVRLLAALVLAGGIVALAYVNQAKQQGFNVSILAPWVQIIVGAVLLLWPGVALGLAAIILGGGFILNGVMGLSAINNSNVVNPPLSLKLTAWLSIALGVLVIAMGAYGSAVFLGIVLGIALINSGLSQWRLAA